MSSQQRPGGGLAAASVSSGRAVLGAAKHKNWRANYLRALNIYTPDVDLARARVVVDPRQRGRPAGAVGGANAAAAGGRRGLVRTADEPARRSAASEKSSSSSGNRSAVSRLLGRRSTTSSSNNNNSHASPSPPDEHKGSYVFGMRSHLFRARRPATRGDVLVVDRVSAPIEIPTAQTPTQHTPIASERRDSRAKTPIAMADADSQARSNRQQQLLSWEEPSVMLGGSNGWPLEIDKPGRRPDKSLQFDSSDLPFVVGRRPPTYPTQHSSHRDGSEYSRRFDGTALGRHCRVGIPEEECDETEDDETEDLDRADDSRDDQEDESEEEDDIFKMDELEDSTRPKLKKKSSFRAFGDGENRTSYSSLGAGRRRGSLPAPTSTMRGNQDDTDEYRTLSESFVPPHQMVERDCFSLGLRDELKRRPLRT